MYFDISGAQKLVVLCEPSPGQWRYTSHQLLYDGPSGRRVALSVRLLLSQYSTEPWGPCGTCAQAFRRNIFSERRGWCIYLSSNKPPWVISRWSEQTASFRAPAGLGAQGRQLWVTWSSGYHGHRRHRKLQEGTSLIGILAYCKHLLSNDLCKEGIARG